METGMLHCTDSHDCAMCILKWPPKCIVSWKNAGETGDDDEVVPLLRGRGARGRAREAGAEEEENRARGESRCPSRDKLEEGQKNRLLMPSPVVWAFGFLLTVVYFSVSWHVLFHKELFLLDRFFLGHILLRSPNSTDSTKAVKERAERIISGSRNQPGHIVRLIVQLSFSFCFIFPMQQIHTLSREQQNNEFSLHRESTTASFLRNASASTWDEIILRTRFKCFVGKSVYIRGEQSVTHMAKKQNETMLLLIHQMRLSSWELAAAHSVS